MPLLWKLVSWCGDSLVSLWNSRVWQRGILFIQHGVFHPVRSFGHLFYLANPLVRQLQILFRTGTLFVTMDPTQQKRADEIVIDQNQEFYTLLLFVVKWRNIIGLHWKRAPKGKPSFLCNINSSFTLPLFPFRHWKSFPCIFWVCRSHYLHHFRTANVCETKIHKPKEELSEIRFISSLTLKIGH